MEIGGYAHSENVCSNFLAYFFDPNGSHGLGSLFLNALLDTMDLADRDNGLGRDVSVAREVVTEAGNRIDILLQWESWAVLIENKIFAAVNNPFDDYAAYLCGLKTGGKLPRKHKVKILLTLQPSEEGREQGFVNLTYGTFVGAVRSGLGQHITGAEPRYLPLLLDFLNTLENLGKGTRMNHDYVALLAERKGEVEEFLQGVNDIRVELRGKVQELERVLIEQGSDPSVTHVPWKPDVSLVHYLQIRIQTAGKSFIGIETEISPSGWKVHVFSRGPEAPKRSDLEDLLRDFGIGYEDTAGSIRLATFAYDEDLSNIAPIIRNAVDKFGGAARQSYG